MKYASIQSLHLMKLWILYVFCTEGIQSASYSLKLVDISEKYIVSIWVEDYNSNQLPSAQSR